MMHKDEFQISEETVKNLIAGQFPKFSGLPVQKVSSMGTVNAVYRLGNEYCIRLPLLESSNDSLHREWAVLPAVSKSVTLAVPEIIGKGRPDSDYPFDWAVYGWVDGDIYNSSKTDETETAEILAQFITELHSVQIIDSAPKAGRKPLRELDEVTLTTLPECSPEIDSGRAIKIWNELLDSDVWDGKPVWIHADLLKPNLIVSNGRLSAVIDFGSAGIGDPAFDLIPAWAVLSSKTIEMFKRLLNPDENIWQRAKAYALHQAALIIPYYRKSNPAFVSQAINTIRNIL